MMIERMSPEQIKQIIGRLQKALEEKTRGDQPKKPDGDKGKKPDGDKPKVKGAQSQEDILRRLDQINKELEDIRRSLKK